MVASQIPGNCSSVHLLDASAAETLLSQLCSEKLSSLIAALGTEAQLHLVGGCVRDTFLGRTDFDLDLACAFPAAKSKEILERSEMRVIDTGLQHGTITAVIDGVNVEITTFRQPGSGLPAESIEADLRYRDFTINAIAFSVNERKIIDPLGGLQHLDDAKLCATGPAPERIKDDPLRILRAIRFGPASGRCLDSELAATCRQLGQTLAGVSVERIRVELTKILVGSHAAEGVRALASLEILQYVLPELLPSIGFEQNDFHIHDVFEHTLWVLERCPADPVLRWSAIFHDIAKPLTLSIDERGRRHFYRHEELGTEVANTIMQRLKFSNREIDAIGKIVRHHMRPVDCGAPGLRRLMRDLGSMFASWRIFKFADAPPKTSAKDLDAAFSRFDKMYATELSRQKGAPYGKLAIGGEELKQIGVQAGPEMGKILRALEEFVLDEPTRNTQECLMLKARQLLELTLK